MAQTSDLATPLMAGLPRRRQAVGRTCGRLFDHSFGRRAALPLTSFTHLPRRTEKAAYANVPERGHCPCLFSLTLARGEVPVPVGLRLFLPSVWTDDPARCAKLMCRKWRVSHKSSLRSRWPKATG
jgi:hypothetical protein